MDKKLKLTIVVFIAVIVLTVLIYYCKQPSFQIITGNQKTIKIPTFGDYLAPETFAGKMAAIDYSSNGNAKEFKGQIQKQTKEGVNFAGHYVIVSWGCGTSCQIGVVVDAANGKVYDLPLWPITCGMEFRVDSKLLIIDSDEDCVKDPNLGTLKLKTRYYLWKDS